MSMDAAELKASRRRLKFNQQQLADKLDLNRKHISQMECGHVPVSRRTELSVRYLLIDERPTPG